MAADSGRTERATPRKRDDERKKGNVYQSKDAVSAFTLLLMALLLKMAGTPLIDGMKRVLTENYSTMASFDHMTPVDATGLLGRLSISAMLLILPVTGAAMALGVVLTGVQTRFLFTPSLLRPKFSRLNPLDGLKNLFSLKALMELVKSILKVVLIGVVLYNEIAARVAQMRVMPLTDLGSDAAWIADAVFTIIIKILVFMLFLAAADYIYQWWEYERKMRMTKQEVRDEQKRLEGDPNIKGRIREVQRKMAMMRMMQKVPTADVVIRNPTHYAVALKYNPQKDKAPIVVAKGADQIALTIVRIAKEHNVYITENKPLARGLYEAVDIGKAIPESFYKPVADVIAFIYKLRKKAAG